MDNKKAEQERKELNKKLLKNTFNSELREKKKSSPAIIDFIFLFIALGLADLIVSSFKIDFWLIEITLATVFAMILFFVRDKVVAKFKK